MYPVKIWEGGLSPPSPSDATPMPRLVVLFTNLIMLQSTNIKLLRYHLPSIHLYFFMLQFLPTVKILILYFYFLLSLNLSNV